MIAAAPFYPASNSDIDPIIRRIVGRKIQRLVTAGVIQQQDALDLEHDLYLRVLQGWPSFDSERSHAYAFATTIVERAVASMLRDRRAEKRDPSRLERLATDVATNSKDCGHVELAADVATVVGRLPDHLRSLAEKLKRASVSQVARDANVSRTTIYREVRQLREWFEQSGFKEEKR